MEEEKRIDKIFFPCENCDKCRLEILWLQEGMLNLRCSSCGNCQVSECSMVFREDDLELREE